MATYEVTVTNGTPYQVIAPPIVIAHDRDFKLFKIGEAASDGLAYLAENGDPSMLASELSGNPDVVATAIGGPVLPGKTVTVEIQAPRHARFSIAGMLANTNDAFFSVMGVGSHGMEMGHVFDAGSEANNEDCAYVPGPACPSGSGNARDTADAEGFVHFHTGVHGIKDLNASQLDWRGPVAIVKVRRMY